MASHVWTMTVSNKCNTQFEREVTYVAPADFASAMKAGVELVEKKFPNPWPDKWPEEKIHPDYEVIGVKRGMELDDDQEEPL